MFRTKLILVLLVVALAVSLWGCGGDEDNFGPPAVQGVVVNADNMQGASGVVVTIGGRSATSNATGNFFIGGLTAGFYQILVSTGSSGYVLAGSTPMYVTVDPLVVTVLGAPILVVPVPSGPPDPA